MVAVGFNPRYMERDDGQVAERQMTAQDIAGVLKPEFPLIEIKFQPCTEANAK